VAPSVQRRKVWLTPNTGVPCSNAAKTQNPLKFVEEILLLNKSFFRSSIRALVAKI